MFSALHLLPVTDGEGSSWTINYININMINNLLPFLCNINENNTSRIGTIY
jgi:hypothetical protein